MANQGYFNFTPGLGTLGVLLLGEDRTTRWNGSALVPISSIASGSWTTGIVSATEQVTSNSLATGIYAYNVPGGISAQELVSLLYSTTTPAYNAQPIGQQLLPWTGATVATLDAIQAEAANEYVAIFRINRAGLCTVVLTENSIPLTSGVTNPALSVLDLSQGSTIINAATLSPVSGWPSVYKYQASPATSGDALVAGITATYAGGSQTFVSLPVTAP